MSIIFELHLILLVLTRLSSANDEYCSAETHKGSTKCNFEIWCNPNRPREIKATNVNGEICCSSVRRVGYLFQNYFIIDSVLDDSVSFFPFFESVPIDCQQKDKLLTIDLAAITGIQRSFKVTALAPGYKEITLIASNLRMMENEIDKADCSKNLNASIFQTDQTLDLTFAIGLRYDQDTCDQLFHMAKISYFEMYDLVDSMIKRNIFGVERTSAVEDLQSNIETVIFRGYALALNQKSFPVRVFGKASRLTVKGTIKQFQGQILRGSELNKIKLKISGVRKFLHNNLDWLDYTDERSTNKTLRVFLDGKEENGWNSNNEYDTYDEMRIKNYLYQIDSEMTVFETQTFCQFYRLKQKNLNLEIYGKVFQNQAERICDCALLWLLKSYKSNPDYLYFRGAFKECSRHQDELEKSCDFEAMASRCLFDSIEPITESSGYSFVWTVKFTHFVLNTVMTSSLSCLAFALNLFVVYVFHRLRSSEQFRKKKLTDKNQSLWTYVYYNAIFVSLQALIFAFEPLTACIQNDGIYCSPLILTHFGQGFYLFVQSYLGNALRLIANVTNSLFVLYRFGMNADRLAKLRKAKPKKVVFICMLPVLLISVITLFVNERFDLKVFNGDKFHYILRGIRDHQLPTLTLKIIFLTNMILGNIVFNLLNVIVDLRLLIFLRNLKNASRKEEAEARVTKMIVFNGVFSFLFRTPEMAFSISYLVFTFNPLLFPSCELTRDITLSACPSLAKISQFFFSFSFFENFILLYLFNPEFNQQARKIFGKQEEPGKRGDVQN
nr:G protein-coupled receptor [Proales similis]